MTSPEFPRYAETRRGPVISGMVTLDAPSYIGQYFVHYVILQSEEDEDDDPNGTVVTMVIILDDILV